MDEGWHVAGMILTVQVAEKRKLAAHTTAQPPASRTAVLYSRATQAPMAIAIPSGRVRFATFEVDLRSGELHKQGIKIKLHDQPFQVLTRSFGPPTRLSISMSALILRSKDCATRWAIQPRNPATSRPCPAAATASSPRWRPTHKAYLRHRFPPNPPQKCGSRPKPLLLRGPTFHQYPTAFVEPGSLGCCLD